eukprot:scaffold9984_cov148-Skeletonema_dohrnii-CCMP3373.AAC.15
MLGCRAAIQITETTSNNLVVPSSSLHCTAPTVLFARNSLCRRYNIILPPYQRIETLCVSDEWNEWRQPSGTEVTVPANEVDEWRFGKRLSCSMYRLGV